MTDASQQQSTPPPRAAVGAPTPRAAVIVPFQSGTPRTPITPSSRRKSPLAISNGLDPKRTTPGQKQNGRGEGGGRGGAARSLLRGAAAVVLLMLAGIMASEINLRLSSTGVSMVGTRCRQGHPLIMCHRAMNACPLVHVH